ncbi:MAG TPA: helix-turn-helix domain-containing protein [Aestuariivirga sp.]|nr:helix-turn-helix domain-containing protein [Aestuariivirga sp.]
MKIERETVTVEEASKALGIGRNTAYEAVKSGEIPSIKIGKRRLISKAALMRLLDGTLNPSAGKAA